MKMKLKIKNRSHRYNIKLYLGLDRHKYTKYKMCLNIMVVLRISFNPFMTGAVICSANQWTGFYMITALVMKGLRTHKQHMKLNS